MTPLVQNLGIYFPVQIWKNNNLFRLEPPQLGTRETWEFLPHFLDQKESASQELKNSWKYLTTIWTFNPKYLYYLTRGFNFVTIFQNLEAPFNTNYIVPFGEEDFSKYGSFNYIWSFGFYNYPVPGTTLLFFSLGIERIKYKLLDLVLVNEKTEDDSTNNKYNFLPFKKNKDIPFYEIFAYDKQFFTYIFEKKPTNQFWKSNSEGICIPSENSKDYTTALECVKKNINIYPRSIFLASNNAPLVEILGSDHSEPSASNNYTNIYIILFIFVILLWIISFWSWIYHFLYSSTRAQHNARSSKRSAR